MNDGEELTATLLVDGWFSKCSHCNLQTLPDKLTHDVISGYGPSGRPGCGARFVAIGSTLINISWTRLHQMRPDLPVVGNPS